MSWSTSVTRPGHHRPGRKVLTLVHALVASGDCIHDAEVLRTGSTAAVLGHRVMAPSTLGTFLRAFTFGYVRQLDRVAETVMGRAWTAGPGNGPMTIDVDSTVCEVHGHHKGGATYGYTRQLGYHPLLATRADTGEVLHVRQRSGRAASARGAERFVNETAGRVRRAGATGQLTLRADSGFWAAKVLAAAATVSASRSPCARPAPSPKRSLPSVSMPGPTLTTPTAAKPRWPRARSGADRLVVRRTRLTGAQATLWPDWRYHAFVTDPQGSAVELDADHGHAVCELAIRDLKDGAGLRHCPSGRFLANAAWLLITALAHNLLRWTSQLGLGSRGLVVAKTLRRRLLTLPGRLTRSARRWRLHLPTGWPWASEFAHAITGLRALPAAT
jgi:DDE family transposase